MKNKQLIKTKPTVVFDMDGVLIDVSNSYKTAIKQTYQHFVGVQLDEDEIIKSQKHRQSQQRLGFDSTFNKKCRA
ncbi:MAG: hypothetical protein L6V95_06785 [Candidatus Melainabacteria bacterium]|nr:MAG: hypothetical protein L6V95_06785 [Candidatus Melainabacteria bacterium]